MINHPQYGTLDEYFEKLKERITKGFPVLSAGMTLNWYADEYVKLKRKPAEPGGLNPTNPMNQTPSPQSITLAVIDELRELNSRGDTQQLAQRLEQLAINR